MTIPGSGLAWGRGSVLHSALGSVSPNVPAVGQARCHHWARPHWIPPTQICAAWVPPLSFSSTFWFRGDHSAEESDSPRLTFSLWARHAALSLILSSSKDCMAGATSKCAVSVRGDSSEHPDHTAGPSTPALSVRAPCPLHLSAFFSSLAPMFDIILKGQLISSVGEPETAGWTVPGTPCPEDPTRRRGREDG